MKSLVDLHPSGMKRLMLLFLFAFVTTQPLATSAIAITSHPIGCHITTIRAYLFAEGWGSQANLDFELTYETMWVPEDMCWWAFPRGIEQTLELGLCKNTGITATCGPRHVNDVITLDLTNFVTPPGISERSFLLTFRKALQHIAGASLPKKISIEVEFPDDRYDWLAGAYAVKHVPLDQMTEMHLPLFTPTSDSPSSIITH